MGQMSLIPTITAHSAIQNGQHQVTELIARELIPLDIWDQLPPPINDRSMQRVVHQTLIWESNPSRTDWSLEGF
jgi:hypothetical protein